VVYLIILVFSIILALYLKRDFHRELPFAETSKNLLYISLLISGTLSFIRFEKVNIIIRLVLGYAMLIPTGFILKRTFGVTVFRTPLILIYAFILITVIYGIFLAIAKNKLAKEAKELNKLIK
jgi:multidrug transporter EmrE-like cation transporter